MYGRGAPSIAEQIGSTVPEAQKIIDNFFSNYPRVKDWIDKTQADAKRLGYVEDHWGRRRRLPDILRPLIDVKYTDKSKVVVPADFNPLLGSTGKYSGSTKSDIDTYREKALAARGRKEIEAIKAEALTKGIEIHENGGFIAQAERQCVNARIQGGASSMTKIAMARVNNDQELKDLGFKMLICVHDELIGECPEYNADKVADRLCYLMKTCVENDLTVPFKCDPTITYSWYEDEVAHKLQENWKKAQDKDVDLESFIITTIDENPELTHDQVIDLLNYED